MVRLHLPLLAALLASCTPASSVDSGEGAEGELIGGTQAAPDQFPSTLWLSGLCTAAKVGRRHILTAAHCVDDATGFGVHEDFRPGGVILANSSVVADGRTLRDLRITRTLIHPSHRPKELGGIAAATVADVAIIEIDDESATRMEDIPNATIDVTPLMEEEPIVIQGFGCEEQGGFGRHRLKFQPTHVASQDLVDRGLASRMPLTSNFFTRGPRFGEAMACPGDSGGPVYRGDGQSRRIVGVNSGSFGDTGAQIGTEHARLDVESLFDIGSWLGAIEGVQVHGAISGSFVDCSDPAMLVCGAIATAERDAGTESFGRARMPPQWATRHDGVVVWRQDFDKKRVNVERATGSVVVMDRANALCEDKANATFCSDQVGDVSSRSFYECQNHALESRIDCPTKCALRLDNGDFSLGCEPEPVGAPAGP